MNLQNILLEKVFKRKANDYEIYTLQVFEPYSWDFDNLEGKPSDIPAYSERGICIYV